MGDRSKFDGEDRRDPKARDEVRLDGTKRPRTHLGFPTPPPTPGTDVAFPSDEVTRRTPIPAQLVNALKPSQPPKRETTQPFAADMPVPPPATGHTLPPQGASDRPQNPRRTAVGGHGSPATPKAPVANTPPAQADAATTVRPQSSQSAPLQSASAPGPSLRLDPSDFGKAPTQPMPPKTTSTSDGPRLQLDETSTHSLESPTAAAPATSGGPQLQLEADDHLQGPASRRSGGKGLLVVIIALALAGGAAFAFQQGGGLRLSPQAAEPPVAPVSTAVEAEHPGTPASTATAAPEAVEQGPQSGSAAIDEQPTAAAEARAAEAAREAKEARAAAAKKAKQAREAEARKAAAAKRRRAAARRAAAKQNNQATEPSSAAAAAQDPGASSDLEEARKALQELGADDDGVLEVRPSDDAPPSPESDESYDDLPPPPPPPPSGLADEDSFDEPY